VITLHLCYYNTELSPLDFTSPSATASQKWSGNEGEGDDAKHEMGNGMHTDPPPSLENITLVTSNLPMVELESRGRKRCMCETGRTARYPLAGHVSTWKLGSLEYLTST
jgi:hypothetical protein